MARSSVASKCGGRTWAQSLMTPTVHRWSHDDHPTNSPRGPRMTRFSVLTVPAPTHPDESRFDMRTVLGPLELPNPVLTASGCAAAGRELDQFFDLAALGAVVTKSIMLAPRSGRATPRMAETPSGMLNSIGLQGPGIEIFVERDLPWLVEQGARAVVSIAGST